MIVALIMYILRSYIMLYILYTYIIIINLKQGFGLCNINTQFFIVKLALAYNDKTVCMLLK